MKPSLLRFLEYDGLEAGITWTATFAAIGLMLIFYILSYDVGHCLWSCRTFALIFSSGALFWILVSSTLFVFFPSQLPSLLESCSQTLAVIAG